MNNNYEHSNVMLLYVLSISSNTEHDVALINCLYMEWEHQLGLQSLESPYKKFHRTNLTLYGSSSTIPIVSFSNQLTNIKIPAENRM